MWRCQALAGRLSPLATIASAAQRPEYRTQLNAHSIRARILTDTGKERVPFGDSGRSFMIVVNKLGAALNAGRRRRHFPQVADYRQKAYL